MNVREWMKHPVHSVKPLDSIQNARDVMEKHRVNQLPVVVDRVLVGIISDRDLRDAFPSLFDVPPFSERPKAGATDPRQVTVEMTMSPNVHTIQPGDSMANAARLMRQHRIGALPVIEHERVVAILTRTDLLACFVDLAERADASVA